MRTNAIMHFHCAECGTILNLVYPEEAAKPTPTGMYRLVEPGAPTQLTDEPTGAVCMYVQTISIQPCGVCIERHTGPAKQMEAAIKAMSHDRS